MLLAKPLAAGETATLEYSTSFHYPAPPPPEFRRVVQYFVENLDIRVEFHPGKLPADVVWAVWDGMDGPIVERESVSPGQPVRRPSLPAARREDHRRLPLGLVALSYACL